MIRVFCNPPARISHIDEISLNIFDLSGRFTTEVDGIQYDCTYTTTRDNLRNHYSYKYPKTFMELSIHERINQKHNNTFDQITDCLYRKGTAWMITYSMMHDNNTKHFKIF